MKKFFFLILVLLILLNLIFVSAVPELPLIVSGNASINDKLARIGTEISARVDGNEVAKTETGDEGRFTLLLQRLEEGQEVGFYVEGVYANENISYKSGDFRQLNLKVEKSYSVYYFGGALIILLGAGIIWKRKLILKRKRK